MAYPINKSPWIKSNPYLNKITIQFKWEKVKEPTPPN